MKNSGLFKPGESGNPSGRPKGSRNKNSLRDKVFQLIDENFERIQADLDSLEPKDRIQTLLRILEFSLPKMRAVEFYDDIDRLSDDQLDEILEQIKSISYEQIREN